MSRSTRSGKEYTQLQEALHQNKKLKREISSLRKQLARLDLDRHDYVKNIVEEHYAREEAEESAEAMVKRLKEEWKCRECGYGYLEVVPFLKQGKTWYFRQCNNCPHRTKSQEYNPEKVQGPVKEPVSKRK